MQNPLLTPIFFLLLLPACQQSTPKQVNQIEQDSIPQAIVIQPVATKNQPPAPCKMQPFLPESIKLPKRGFKQIGQGNNADDEDVSEGKPWERFPGKTYDLLLKTEGPGGSGRYWTITVNIDETRTTEPQNGICFETSTLGWRTLQGFENGGLNWAEDLNGDGDPELIVWASFFAGDDPDTAPHPTGLCAWVYRKTQANQLVLDWDLSRKFADRVAAEYRRPHDNVYLQEKRNVIAEQIELFAKGGCLTGK
jgi:hypothetical protein